MRDGSSSEANPIIRLLADIAADVIRRRREAAERRRRLTLVKPRSDGGQAA